MAKKKPMINMAGFEAQVDELLQIGNQLDTLESREEDLKEFFRNKAAEAMESQGQDVTVAFYGSDGTPKKVSPVDPTKASSRLKLDPMSIAGARDAGIPIDDMVETSISYTLTGPWAKWFSDYLATQNILESDGIAKREMVRLSERGAVSLRNLFSTAASGAARALYSVAIKSLTVR